MGANPNDPARIQQYKCGKCKQPKVGIDGRIHVCGGAHGLVRDERETERREREKDQEREGE